MNSAPVASRKRTLAACCGAHLLHDGFSDLLYVMLPVWQVAFGLSLAQTGLLKALYSGSLAALQVPAGLLAELVGERRVLVMGTVLASVALIACAGAGGYPALAACLMLAGAGASVQHPIGSALTSQAFDGKGLRAALGTYNFFGDVGKVVLPSICAVLLTGAVGAPVMAVMGAIGLSAALAIAVAAPRDHLDSARKRAVPARESGGSFMTAGTAEAGHPSSPSTRGAMLSTGFMSLSAIGIIDSATRMGCLTMLPFVLRAKGASVLQIGLALSLTFAGGAAGKFAFGLFAEKVGVLRTTVLTEIATCALILLLLPVSLGGMVVLLPLLGLMLNGTSSVLYGTVAELVPAQRRARAFGVFYTLTIGAGALAPIAYGALGDVIGVDATLQVIAVAVLLVLPMTLGLRASQGRFEGR